MILEVKKVLEVALGREKEGTRGHMAVKNAIIALNDHPKIKDVMREHLIKCLNSKA